jgi:cell wall-associated NlpC family hydrolase
MRDKLLRFIDNTIGHFQEVSYKEAIYQCMDLVYEWVFVLDIPKATIQHQYAYEVYTQASDFTRQYFDIILNLKETIPQEGDLVIWNKTSSNIAGHIAIVIEATQTTMKVFEQNNPLGTNAHIQDRNYPNCLGFLRPKVTQAEGVPQWLKTLFQESGLSFDDEGEFRSFWEKALKYDDDIKALQGQVKSANEALSDRALEVSLLTEKNQKLSDKVAEVEELNNSLRSDKDTLVFEKAKLEALVEKLTSENEALQNQVDALKGTKPLLGYSWFERFVSLFKFNRG